MPGPSHFIPFLIMVGVAPLPTQRPWETTTSTPFGASVSSVSSTLVSRDPLPVSGIKLSVSLLLTPMGLSVNAPSAAVGN